MTSFLVTNGTMPDVVSRLQPLPTQLYVTLAAPDKEIYEKTCKPVMGDGWERINRTLEILEKINTRRVIRLTLAKGLNFVEAEKYARLVKNRSDFVEVKAFMSVGFSRKRLGYDRMPDFKEIKEFSEKIAKEIDYKLIDWKEDSRVCLIAKKVPKWRKFT